MGQPDGGQVSVATNTLRSEAAEWDTESGQMAALAATTSGMEFSRLEAGIFQLMVGPYDTLVQAVTERCREATTAMADIGTALHGVADTYDAEDKAAADRIHKTTK
jgi:hypothetical protein